MTRANPAKLLLATLASLCLASAAVGDPVTDPTAAPPDPDAKPKPGKPPSPFTFTGTYRVDLLDNASGGLRRGVGYIDQARLSVAYDGAQAGHDGWTALASVEHSNGSTFTADRLGGQQEVSSLEASPEAFRISGLWAQKEFLEGKVGLKAGLVDINTTYDFQGTAALFLNSSHGIGIDFSQSGLDGPSIDPTPALGITGFYRPIEGWTLQAAVFDGVAGNPEHPKRIVDFRFDDGALFVAQAERRFGSDARFEVGGWAYTAAFDALDQTGVVGPPRQTGGDVGVYALAEGRLIREGKSEDSGLSGWIRMGAADGHINPVTNYVGAGLVYTGLFPGRDEDQAGVAIAFARFGTPARRASLAAGDPIDDNETDLEATYRYAVTDWLNLQPDLQYVIHPGGRSRIGNAVVIGLRAEFTVSK